MRDKKWKQFSILNICYLVGDEYVKHVFQESNRCLFKINLKIIDQSSLLNNSITCKLLFSFSVLQAICNNTQYQIIPRRIKISKRLAQCMHPALPSGVHLKALETYDVIFSKTGPERLATELFIYR